MIKYVAFLRGINISGKNKIDMVKLKECFEKIGFSDVVTYLNSGNVIFHSENTNTIFLALEIKSAIKTYFLLDIPVCVISQNNLKDCLQNAPVWWNGQDCRVYNNLIILFPDITYDDFLREVGLPNDALEQTSNYKGFIFWSFQLDKYRKSFYYKKTAMKPISDYITIRTLNTIKRIISM